MKKRLLRMIIIVLVVSACGCKGSTGTYEEQSNPVEEVTEVIGKEREESNPAEEVTEVIGKEQEELVDGDSRLVQNEVQEELLQKPTDTPVHVHAFTDIVTKEATCSVDGKLTRTCSECGEVNEVAISANGDHLWNEGTLTAEPTCLKEGISTFSCTVCDATKTERIAVSGSHMWDKGTVTKQPTCGADGIKTFTCNVCEATKNESVNATDAHKWNDGVVTKEPTCQRTGVRTRTCTVCNVTETEDIPATDEHSWNEGVVTKEPTKNTTGIYTYTCYLCKKTKDEETGTHYFDAAEYGDPHHIRSSNNPDCYLDFSISGNTLTVSGKIVQEGLEMVWIRCGEDGNPSYVSSGQLFSESFSLNGITENNAQQVTIYTKTHTDTMFWGYSWNDVKVTKQNGEYRFVPSLVLEHNLEVMSHWVNPKNGLSATISEEFVKLSNQIVGNETDDYRKIYLLNLWVAENIYYDFDYYYGKSNELYYSATEVLGQRRSVCGGYANLLQKLIQAQGIPCIQVSTYSAGLSTKGYFDESNYLITNSNHAHVEAFVDGRWVVMDSTWDSGNKYENGQFIYEPATVRYFDANLGFFSYSHKLIGR